MATSALIPVEASLGKSVLYVPLACGQANAPDQKRAGASRVDKPLPLPSSVSGC